MEIVELRVHGVSGTPPEHVLDDPHPVEVAGDDASGFWRHRSEGAGRFVEEAYAWGGLTSGSPTRAAWVLLAPFAFVNAAFAMHPRHRSGAVALARVFALSLTATLVGATYIVSTDLFAWQCGNDSSCIDAHSYTRFLGWSWLDSPGRRLTLSLVLPVAVIAVLWNLARATWQAAERYHREATVMPRESQTPFDHPEFWDGRERGELLRHLHVAAAVATIATELAYAFVRTTNGGELQLVAGIVVLVACIGLVIPDVGPHVARVRNRLGVVVLVAAWVTLASLAVYGWTEPGFTRDAPQQLPGVDRAVTYLFVGQVLAVAVLWAITAWPAAALYLLALALGAGFSAGVVVQGGDFLDPGTDVLVLPNGVVWAARGSVVLLAALAFAALLAGVALAVRTLRDVVRRLRRRPAPDPVARAIATARLTERLPVIAGVVMAALVVVLVAGTVIVVITDLGVTDYWKDLSDDATWRGLTVVGSRTTALFAIALVLLVRRSYRSVALRRHIGIAWDIATFWPRGVHPLAPPCYAERAVPELSARIAETTAGDPTTDDPRPRTNPVVVSAHSQGTVIAVAALLRQGQAVNRVALVTYGSPLDRIYQRYFPAYFMPLTTQVLHARLHGRWLNLLRRTDPIGGTVAAATNWEVPIDPDDIRRHSDYTAESYYRDAMTQSELGLTGRLYA
jgi:hypothetical protein